MESDRLGLEGYATWRRGDPGAAAQLLVPSNRLGSPNAIRPVRWWLAQIYRELGRPEEALRYLEAFWGAYARVAPPYLELGRVHEELGNTQQARQAFETFVIAFEDADPELQPLVEEARQALARLMDAPSNASPP